MPADTATQTWPTRAELDELAALLVEAADRLDELAIRVRALDDELDAHGKRGPVPTLAEIGALSRLIASVEHDLRLSDAHVQSIRQVRDSASIWTRGGHDDARG